MTLFCQCVLWHHACATNGRSVDSWYDPAITFNHGLQSIAVTLSGPPHTCHYRVSIKFEVSWPPREKKWLSTGWTLPSRDICHQTQKDINKMDVRTHSSHKHVYIVKASANERPLGDMLISRTCLKTWRHYFDRFGLSLEKYCIPLVL